MKQYAIAVVGAGSGGLTAAVTARRRGMRVALLEKNKIGARTFYELETKAVEKYRKE